MILSGSLTFWTMLHKRSSLLPLPSPDPLQGQPGWAKSDVATVYNTAIQRSNCKVSINNVQSDSDSERSTLDSRLSN
jgi:hypothetical protein